MKLDKISAGYGRKIIIRDFSLEIQNSEILSLIGPNGGGKSTLLKSISGQLALLGGEIYLDGDSLSSLPLKELARRLSIVTTERISPEHMTGRDVVLSGRLPFTDGFGTIREADRREADRALELMNLGGIADSPFTSLSDGQKQRILIARAICQRPKYLVMDEPTSYLDIRYRMELMDVLKKLSCEGVTIVMSIHELELALQISDRLLLVHENGSVTAMSPKEALESDAMKELFGMTEEMFRRVIGQLRSAQGGAPAGGSLEESFSVEDAFAGSPAAECVSAEGFPAESGTGDPSEKVEPGSALNPGGGRHATYFVNRECEYFPCHDLDADRFNCLFCYCPLYEMEDCGGTFSYTAKGIKNCVDCTFPHERENYGRVIKKLKERMYGDR